MFGAPPFDAKIISLQVSFSDFLPVSTDEILPNGGLISDHLFIFQLMFSKFEYDGKLNPTFVEGPFQLPLSSIRAYINEPITPR